jgi:hypothetical protein
MGAATRIIPNYLFTNWPNSSASSGMQALRRLSVAAGVGIQGLAAQSLSHEFSGQLTEFTG